MFVAEAAGEVVSAAWAPLDRASADARDACLFRIASLLGSRASVAAIAEELSRIRAELGLGEAPHEDERAANAIAAWFAGAAAS